MSIFDTAEVFQAPAKKDAKKKPREIAVPGIRDVAALDLVIKTITSAQTVIKDDVKSAMIALFLKEGYATGRQPKNFKGIDGKASASCQLRSRSTATNIPVADQALLAKYNISTETKSDVIETFIINPDYINDSSLLEAVSKALSGIEGLPKDFIQKQAASTKVTLTDRSLPDVFALALKRDEAGKQTVSPEEIATLLDLVSTPAITPSFGSKDAKEAFDLLAEIVPEFGDEKTQEAAKAVATETLAATLRASLAQEQNNKVTSATTPVKKTTRKKAA